MWISTKDTLNKIFYFPQLHNFWLPIMVYFVPLLHSFSLYLGQSLKGPGDGCLLCESRAVEGGNKPSAQLTYPLAGESKAGEIILLETWLLTQSMIFSPCYHVQGVGRPWSPQSPCRNCASKLVMWTNCTTCCTPASNEQHNQIIAVRVTQRRRWSHSWATHYKPFPCITGSRKIGPQISERFLYLWIETGNPSLAYYYTIYSYIYEGGG